jgi:hypothetical protein
MPTKKTVEEDENSEQMNDRNWASPKHALWLGNTRRGPVSSTSPRRAPARQTPFLHAGGLDRIPYLGRECARSTRDYWSGIGIVKTKLVSSAVDVTAILPPCAWAICEAM